MFNQHLFILSILGLGSTKISIEGLFYAGLTVFVTVFLIIMIKAFGRIETDITGLGTDFNLLTYGFLWDIAVGGFRGESFWSNYSLSNTFLTKELVLSLIIILNTLIMGLNFRLESKVNQCINDNNNATFAHSTSAGATPPPPPLVLPHKKLKIKLFKVFVLALGVVSLLIYLYTNSVWS